MKPKITFSPSGNSYNLNPIIGNTYITAPPPPSTKIVQNHIYRQPASTGFNTPSITSNFGSTHGYGVKKVSDVPSNMRLMQGPPVISDTLPFATTYGNAGTVQSVSVSPRIVTTTPQTTIQQVRKVETLPQPLQSQLVYKGETRTPTSPINVDNEMIQKRNRPQYQRIENQNRVDTRKQIPITNQYVFKQKKCCGPLCWIFIALLGLIALILGLLFGLGIIGGGKLINNNNGINGSEKEDVINGVYPNGTITIQNTIINTTSSQLNNQTNKPNTTYVFPQTVFNTNQTIANQPTTIYPNIPNTSTVLPVYVPPTETNMQNGTNTTLVTFAQPIEVQPIPVQPVFPTSTQPTSTINYSTNHLTKNFYTSPPTSIHKTQSSFSLHQTSVSNSN